MADVETKETKVASPEKKVVEEVVEKKSPEKKVVEKEVEAVDEDSKASENGEAVVEEKESKENGNSKKEAVVEEKETESTENGDSTDAPADNDVCSIKRKSTAGIEPAVDAVDGVLPEKKAKLDTKPVAEAAESNGEEKTVA